MGTTKMGRYDFSSWTIHMAFIIVFSNLWGLLFREWKGPSKRTHRIVFGRVLALVASTVVGFGNYAARPSAVKVVNLKWEEGAGAAEAAALQPRLSWALDLTDPAARGQDQTAYQILVASSPEALEADEGDLWDSGKVKSRQMLQIPYAGEKLQPQTQCWWKVRVWDKSGRASVWSDPAARPTGPPRTPEAN